MHRRFAIILTMWLLAIAPARAQWTEPVKISESGGGYYPQILVRGDTLHVVYENSSGYEKISYVRSIDGGETWSEHVVLSEANGVAVSPRIVGGERLIVLWEFIFNGGAHRFDIGYARSSDAGATWGSTLYMFDPNWDSIGGLTASGSDSLVSVIFGSQQGPDVLFYYLGSTDFGESWSSPGEIFNAYQLGRADCVAFDTLLYFSWDGRFDTDHDYEVYYINSTDAGSTWSPNVALSDTDQFNSQLPAISGNESGQLALTWMDYKYSPFPFMGDIFLRQSPDFGNYWGPEVMLTSNHRAVRSDIAMSGDTIVVAWEDRRPENGQRSIYCTMSADGGETWGEPDRLDEDTLESRYPALAISNEKIHAVWYDDRCDPDTQHCGGIYFSRFPAEPSGVKNDGEFLPNISGLTAYPNPFNSTIIITYKNLEGGEIEIYNIKGQKVRTFEMTKLKEGQIEWDARDALGNKVSSGIYFARAKTSRKSNTLKLLYLK